MMDRDKRDKYFFDLFKRMGLRRKVKSKKMGMIEGMRYYTKLDKGMGRHLMRIKKRLRKLPLDKAQKVLMRIAKKNDFLAKKMENKIKKMDANAKTNESIF